MDLDLGSYLNLLNGIIIIGISLPTLYMSTRIKIRPLRILFALFTLFLTLHGLYHLTYFLGDFTGQESLAFLSESILEPAGYIVLFGFVSYFARRGG